MKDLYKEVTDRIIDELESGVIPWEKPWTGTRGGAISHESGKPYSLINQMLLWEPGEYATFNQVKKEGGRVKKGAKAKVIIFWKVQAFQKKDENGAPIFDENGIPEVTGRPVLKYFQVFNVEKDCEGIELKWTGENAPETIAPDEKAAAVFADYIRREGIRFEEEKSDKAYYSPGMDLIHLPLMEQFAETAEYYSTAFHEATHSTGHRSRLNRFEAGAAAAAFGSESYSKEELTAEIGAACILNKLGLETDSSFRNSAGYIQGWLRALKNDKRLIIGAAARAEKAVQMILNETEE